MLNLQGGFGSFLTSSVAKFEKKFLKTLELILSSKDVVQSHKFLLMVILLPAHQVCLLRPGYTAR